MKSLADRISSGEMPSEMRIQDTVDIENTTTPTALPDEKTEHEKEMKPPGTSLIQNKHKVAVKLQDLQADPNSPLYSVKSFDELGL